MSPAPAPRLNVLGVGISATDLAAATDRTIAAAASGQPLGVSALAVHAVMEAHSHPDYRARLNTLDLAAPDGQPVRWALNALHGAGLRTRVYGPFLMQAVCARAAQDGLPIYLFGGTAETLGPLATRLAAAHPGLRVAGTRPSRFRRISEAEARQDAQAIAGSGVNFISVGALTQSARAVDLGLDFED